MTSANVLGPVDLGDITPEAEITALKPAELAHHELQAMYEGVGQLATFGAQLRVDSIGYVGEKEVVGGALVVESTLLTQDGPVKRRIDIDDKDRYLSEATITFLGGEAKRRRETTGEVIRNHISTV